MKLAIKPYFQIIIGLVLGALFGMLAVEMGWQAFTRNWIMPWGDIFLNALKLIAVPLVLSSLVMGVTSLKDIRKLSRIGIKTLVLYISTTTIAVVIGLVGVNLFKPGKAVPSLMRDQLQQAYLKEASGDLQQAEITRQKGPLALIVDLVPENFFNAASNNRNLLQIVIISLILGIAILRLPHPQSETIIAFFNGLSESIIQIVNLIMLFAPLGVFAIMAKTIVVTAGTDLNSVWQLFSALGYYGMVVVIGLLIQVYCIYPILMTMMSRMPLQQYFRAVLPVQLLAFSTSSSAATLPYSMEQCKEKLGLSNEVVSFVLPLGATINMDGTALYQSVAAVFIAQALGMGLSLNAQLTIILTAVMSSIGTAAVPGAGIVMLIIILETIQVPTAGIALILGIDRILDMMRTAVNVTGDITVATIIDQPKRYSNPS